MFGCSHTISDYILLERKFNYTHTKNNKWITASFVIE